MRDIVMKSRCYSENCGHVISASHEEVNSNLSDQ